MWCQQPAAGGGEQSYYGRARRCSERLDWVTHGLSVCTAQEVTRQVRHRGQEKKPERGEREREGEGETVAETRSTPSRTNRGVIIPTYRQRKERKRERSSEKGRQEEEKSKKHRAPPHPSRGSGGWSKKILSLAMGEIATSGGRFR